MVERRIEKSKFVAQTALLSTDTLDFVRSNQNFKVAFSDFLTAIGATGSLEQKGEVTGTPILDKDGTINYIRNLINGSGVQVTLTVEDGAKISHNFSIGDSGQPVLVDETEESPTIRNLVAGTGINIAGAGKDIQISATGAVPAFNVVVVNTMSDFPAASAGVRTLGNDTAYLVSAKLTTSDRFVLGTNCVVLGTDSAVSALTYTGTGVMFTGVDVSAKITLLSLSASLGSIFSITESAVSSVFQFVNNSVLDCDSLGTIAGVEAVQVTDVAVNNMTTGGLTLSGNCGLFIAVRNLFVGDPAVMIDLTTSTFTAGFSIETCFFQFLTTPGYLLSGLAGSGNFTGEGSGTVFNCRLINGNGVLENITNADSKWSFQGNNVIPDSINSLLAIKDTSTITTALNTPAIIGNTWIYDHESRFEGSAGGRFTYTGLGSHINIVATVSAVGTVAQSRDYEFLIYKNGVAITNAVFERSFANSQSGSVSIVWEEDLETDDYIELWVQNTESSDNITINSVKWSFS